MDGVVSPFSRSLPYFLIWLSDVRAKLFQSPVLCDHNRTWLSSHADQKMVDIWTDRFSSINHSICLIHTL